MNMCGIAGFVGPNAHENTRKMCGAIEHRGPDAEGIFTDDALQLAIGHRRLAILDLTEAGAQPMTSRNERYVIAFNGEIYNHQTLREKTLVRFPAQQYRGTSDTESLLEAIDVLGLEKALTLCVGMFAFALYDRQEKTLSFARDRAGEKPLYYGWYEGRFFFTSDLIALRSLGIFPAINRSALQLYCNHGYFPAPYTVFENVYKLPAAHSMTLRAPFDTPAPAAPYWNTYDVAMEAINHPFQGSAEDAVDALDGLLSAAVQGQMIADVPLGAFLSGGVDSSLIVATMQKLSRDRVKTFTIGFDVESANEAVYAKAVAEHLGTDHTECYITAKDAQDVIPLLPDLYAEPFADSSQIPTYLVSKLARQHVTVALSGDAGDELFGGYQSYSKIPAVWEKARKIPLRKLLGALAQWASATPLGRVLDRDRLYRGGRLLSANSFLDVYSAISGYWNRRTPVVIGAQPLPYPMNTPEACPPYADLRMSMMDLDFRMYLPDDILIKVDRAGMGVSLESRIPLLDHRIIEFAWSLPVPYKINDGVQKWPLRQLLYRSVPKALIERPKKGFSVPMHEWLTGPLHEWALDLLSEDRLRRQGFFKPEWIQGEWQRFEQTPRHVGTSIWVILMFQAWLDRNGKA